MKVLIADDDPVSRRLLQARLEKWGYTVTTTADGSSALSLLAREDAPRMAILDWMMPGMDGLEVCRRLREEKPEPYTYIIMLTAKGATDDLVQGMRAGADDYVIKPFNAPELNVRIRAGRRILDLQQDLMQARDALRYQATHDPLSGLWNRGAILDLLDREIARSNRERLSLAVVMSDIDHFKRVNDEFGHMAGDAVLKEVARRMQVSIRKYDEIGRYGGEEFLIVIPNSGMETAADIARRVREVVAATPVNTSEGVLPVTVSFGVAVRLPDGSPGAGTLIQAADCALYRAKENGRNRVEVAV